LTGRHARFQPRLSKDLLDEPLPGINAGQRVQVLAQNVRIDPEHLGKVDSIIHELGRTDIGKPRNPARPETDAKIFVGISNRQEDLPGKRAEEEQSTKPIAKYEDQLEIAVREDLEGSLIRPFVSRDMPELFDQLVEFPARSALNDFLRSAFHTQRTGRRDFHDTSFSAGIAIGADRKQGIGSFCFHCLMAPGSS
jgi:hypothetical protein